MDIDKEREALKPCPFCGGEAQVSTHMDEDIWSHNTVPYTTVSCGDCGIGTDATCQGWEPTAQEAWNCRASSAAPAGGVQAPVAWGVFAKLESQWVLQYPVALSAPDAAKHAAMYSDEDEIEVRALYAAPSIAEIVRSALSPQEVQQQQGMQDSSGVKEGHRG